MTFVAFAVDKMPSRIRTGGRWVREFGKMISWLTILGNNYHSLDCPFITCVPDHREDLIDVLRHETCLASAVWRKFSGIILLTWMPNFTAVEKSCKKLDGPLFESPFV
jgi:hypothetical protein